MKNWKELNKKRQYILLLLLLIMSLSLGFFISEINDPNNYKTII